LLRVASWINPFIRKGVRREFLRLDPKGFSRRPKPKFAGIRGRIVFSLAKETFRVFASELRNGHLGESDKYTSFYASERFFPRLF
jgi:hypothetical protein